MSYRILQQLETVFYRGHLTQREKDLYTIADAAAHFMYLSSEESSARPLPELQAALLLYPRLPRAGVTSDREAALLLVARLAQHAAWEATGVTQYNGSLEKLRQSLDQLEAFLPSTEEFAL